MENIQLLSKDKVLELVKEKLCNEKRSEMYKAKVPGYRKLLFVTVITSVILGVFLAFICPYSFTSSTVTRNIQLLFDIIIWTFIFETVLSFFTAAALDLYKSSLSDDKMIKLITDKELNDGCADFINSILADFRDTKDELKRNQNQIENAIDHYSDL